MSNDLDLQKDAQPRNAPVAAPPAKTGPRSLFDDEAEGVSGKKKIILALALLAAGGGVAMFAMKMNSGGSAGAQKQETKMTVTLPPLPPPPPPPPKPTPPPQVEQPKKEMLVQEDVKDDEKKPDNEPPPAPAAATSLKGGTEDSGLAGTGAANPFAGLGRRSGSKFGWYAGPVQSRVAEALRTNRATRSAKLDGVLVKIWPDSNARISRVEFKSGSGQPAVDAAIRQALLGLALAEPPPADMPLPIILRLSARAGLTAQR